MSDTATQRITCPTCQGTGSVAKGFPNRKHTKKCKQVRQLNKQLLDFYANSPNHPIAKEIELRITTCTCEDSND